MKNKEADKVIKKINFITEEENMNYEKNNNLYSISIIDSKMYLEYQDIKNNLHSKEKIKTIGAIHNGFFLENVIKTNCPLTGTLSNGLSFHYTKIINVTENRSDLILN